MRKARGMRIVKLLPLSAVMLLSSCSTVVLFHPQGAVGEHEKSLIIIAAILMLLVVVPVMFMAPIFARRYRESNTKAKYTPEWSHSKTLEIVVWVIPAIIVLVLSVLVWVDSHRLDPYRPLQSAVKPLDIQVVSLNWKWLFIYPRQGIASVNEAEFPSNVPVHFFLTAQTVMNSFFIPQLGSQIMTMGGMQTQLNLIANHPGTYRGISSQFSGKGFSQMTFKAIATTNTKQFQDWIARAKQSPNALDKSTYARLERPSEDNPVTYYSSVEPNLFHSIIEQYMGARHSVSGS